MFAVYALFDRLFNMSNIEVTFKPPIFVKSKRPARYCEICREKIPEKPGQPAKTCGVACSKLRNTKKEKERYQKVKDTTDWKETRALYLAKLADRIAEDPEYAALAHAYAARNSARWKKKEDENPIKRAERLKYKREFSAEWRKALIADPQAYDAYKEKCRHWYASLSKEDRQRIFNKPSAKSSRLLKKCF